jgi:hypothetical protein
MKDFLSVSSFLVSNKDNPVFMLGRPWAFEELHLLARAHCSINRWWRSFKHHEYPTIQGIVDDVMHVDSGVAGILFDLLIIGLFNRLHI